MLKTLNIVKGGSLSNRHFLQDEWIWPHTTSLFLLPFSFLSRWAEADCTSCSGDRQIQGCDTVSLILEYADHLCIGQAVQEMVSKVVRGVVLTQILFHVFIDIFGFDVIT